MIRIAPQLIAAPALAVATLVCASAYGENSPSTALPSVDLEMSGEVRLNCSVSTVGDLSNCALVTERPRGQGLLQEALRLAQTTKITPHKENGLAVAKEGVFVPFIFPRPPPPGFGVGILDCKVAGVGDLSECSLVSERPAIRAVGQRALSAVPNLKLPPGQADGSTRRVRVTVPLTPEEQARPPSPSQVSTARWLQIPTRAQFAAAYPRRAIEGRKAGSVLISCVVTAAGDLESCNVASETPTGEGFGAAALSLARYMKMQPQTENGLPMVGTVTVPVNFAP